MGTEQNKTFCSILLFLAETFCFLPFPEKSIFSIKAMQQETASLWTSLSDTSLYLKLLAPLRLICVKANYFSVTCSDLSDKLLLFFLQAEHSYVSFCLYFIVVSTAPSTPNPLFFFFIFYNEQMYQLF